MDFLTMSKHSEINNSAVDDHHSHVVCPEYGLGTAAFFFNECAKPESVSENSSGVGDLNLLIVDHVNIIQSQEGAQQVTTRHYVRRRRDGDGPAAAGTARVQSDCTNADLNAARQFSVGKNKCDMYTLKRSCIEFGEDIQLQGSFRTDLSMAADTTCTISRGGTSHDKEMIQDHPSKEPEGSLLHVLYLQLLAASKEDLTMRELFASFKTQTSFPSLGMDWKDGVRAHLKTNPYFGEVKGRCLLREQIVQLNATMFDFRAARYKSSVTRSDVQPFESAGMPTALHISCHSNNMYKAIRTSRKSNENTIEDILSESAMETSQKIQQDVVSTKVVST